MNRAIGTLLMLPLFIDGSFQFLLQLESTTGMRIITVFLAAMGCAVSFGILEKRQKIEN